MKQVLLSFLCFLLFSNLFAQEKAADPNAVMQPAIADGRGKITGTIIDSANGQPVEFVTLALIRASDNKAVDGTLTDDAGKFTLSKVPSGNYRLSLVFIGYKTKDIQLDIDEKRDVHDLGKVSLSSLEQTTQEVLVEGKRVLIEEKVDRIVYNAENDATNKG
ncbi:MAG: carboxypeptidase-like regulatory domain-containing protein, partial [Bacteroidia bacterium]|nr:carboxypeptidase-like regulatory domain-containing protein [Bacteroidia bacterium]